MILVAAAGAMVGGFFPWAQPLDLTVWGYDDGDGLVVLSSAAITFLFVWAEWRKVSAYVAIAFALFISLVAAVNLTSEPGPGIVLSALTSVLIATAGVSAVRKFNALT